MFHDILEHKSSEFCHYEIGSIETIETIYTKKPLLKKKKTGVLLDLGSEKTEVLNHGGHFFY